MNNHNPEVLAVVPLPSPAERPLHEVNLARVMLVSIDIVLAGEGLGWRSPAIWAESFGMHILSLWTNSYDLHWMALACVQY